MPVYDSYIKKESLQRSQQAKKKCDKVDMAVVKIHLFFRHYLPYFKNVILFLGALQLSDLIIGQLLTGLRNNKERAGGII